MFLKRLEAKGFKSFAEEMNVEFIPGVNAVVGPNGSGKSNISDSIRWVLGEQSARSLRGAKMEDVIFAGSDSRRALNLAEVTLVFDNKEDQLGLGYSEVSITRKLYRSGESEYFINRQPCRRKDIVELFMDSGLGKEAFSIIGQGKVEEVLSSKPDDRRAIFEEAAGVIKYKQRKLQAEKKLKETEDNLYRVQDILHELNEQIEPLHVQASMAKDYLEKQEELERHEVAYTVWDIERMHEEWKSLDKKCAHLEEQKLRKEGELKKEKEAQSLTDKNVEELNEAITKMQDELMETSEHLEKEESQLRLLEERGKNADEKKSEWEQRLEEWREKNKETSAEFQYQKRKLEQSENKVHSLLKRQEKTREQQKNIEQSGIGEIERLKGEYIERLNEQAAIRNEERNLEEQERQIKRKSASLQEENLIFLEERKEAEKNKKEHFSRLQEAQAQYDKWKKKDTELQGKWSELAKETDEKEKKLYDAYRYLDQTKSRLQVLKEMEADYAGFFYGVKEVLKSRGKSLSGIAGAVAELIDVPKEYVTAVETALGGALQHVVTESESDARKAIQYLKAQNKGRATFMPADVIRQRSLAPHVKETIEEMDGFLAVASNVVRISSSYQNIVENLLGQVVFARSLEEANRIAKGSGYRVRVVTIDGDIVNPGGSMTGGAGKQQKGQILGRQQELADLEKKYTIMQEKTKTLEKNVQNIKAKRDQSLHEREECRQEVDSSRDHLEKIKAELAQAESALSQTHSRLSLFDKESNSLEEEKNRLHRRRQVLRENKDTVQEVLKELEEKIAAMEETEKERDQILVQLKEEETKWKVELAAAREASANDRAETARLEKQQEEESKKIHSLEKDIDLLEKKLIAMDEKGSTAPLDIEKLKEKRERLTQEMTQLRRDRIEGYDRVERLKAYVQQLTHEVNELQKSLQEANVSLNRIDVQLDTRLNHLQETYELTFERARNEYPPVEDPIKTKEKIKLTKMGLEELGTVNLGAIEEFQRVSERVHFLTEQRNDLTQAKDSLLHVIQEMDNEMTRRFSETFSAVQTHFQETFTELFGGGEADLHLTDAEDLLNTGVDILARPPGKKRQHLTLLSGGEKALTAIALLFSIVKVKPAPFCVLDEVEAALDEANVIRFAKYLQSFRDTLQFIVITHRKATMEEADVLYGITMEESGVSKLVSVKLEETAELTETV